MLQLILSVKGIKCLCFPWTGVGITSDWWKWNRIDNQHSDLQLKLRDLPHLDFLSLVYFFALFTSFKFPHLTLNIFACGSILHTREKHRQQLPPSSFLFSHTQTWPSLLKSGECPNGFQANLTLGGSNLHLRTGVKKVGTIYVVGQLNVNRKGPCFIAGVGG